MSKPSNIDFSLLNTVQLQEVAKIAKDTNMRIAAKLELERRKTTSSPKADSVATAKPAAKAKTLTRRSDADGNVYAMKPKAKAATKAGATRDAQNRWLEEHGVSAAAPTKAPKVKAEKAPKAAPAAPKTEEKAQPKAESTAPAAPKAKAAKAPKAPKAAKTTKAPSDSAVDAEDTLAACGGVAPKGDSVRALYLQFLAACSKESSEAYVKSLRRPIGEFVDWCKSEGISTLAQLDTKSLLAYRKAAKRTQDGEVRAVSTFRMSLARVVTFLRSQEPGEVNADISILRVKLTDEEREAGAAAAEDDADDASE